MAMERNKPWIHTAIWEHLKILMLSDKKPGTRDDILCDFVSAKFWRRQKRIYC